MGTGHIIPVTACWEPGVQEERTTSGTQRAVTLNVRKFLSFLPTKDLAPFSYTYPTNNPLLNR